MITAEDTRVMIQNQHKCRAVMYPVTARTFLHPTPNMYLSGAWCGVHIPKRSTNCLRDFELQNIALMLRWWWRAYANPTSLWTTVITKLKWKDIYTDGRSYWVSTGSFFWRALLAIKHVFTWSTRWSIGTGTSISFWYDSWGGTPLVDTYYSTSRPPRSSISLRVAEPIRATLLPANATHYAILFTEESDKLLWRWSANETYTVRSLYRTMSVAGRVKFAHVAIWTFRVPPTVKILLSNVEREDSHKRQDAETENQRCICYSYARKQQKSGGEWRQSWGTGS